LKATQKKKHPFMPENHFFQPLHKRREAMKQKTNRPEQLFKIIPAILVLLLILGGNGLTQDSQSSDSDKKDANKTSVMSDSRDMSEYRPIVGRWVRSSRGNDIGEVRNVVMTEDGKHVKALLSVGGFLGIGEKDVLVDMDQINLHPKSDHVSYLGTEEDLEAKADYNQPEERDDRYGYSRGYDRYDRYPYHWDYYDVRYGRYPYHWGYDPRYDRFNDRYYDGRPYYRDAPSNRYRDRYHDLNRMDRRYRSYDGQFDPWFYDGNRARYRPYNHNN
jgi:sporulation protein YlmC with PRC-barrel domain